ncbi:uncharacterized protein LOC106163070 [Lingula anatina]|uniref:Uncharacterized protein LOC106163070 n=1 Tax=Lingula anatina TaxID=7574 RepID=A0A1S3IEV6_LINAN|nr:uncharacterized protein LOC106163070 [Lingula anatina]|eukprot:XP_013395994.1 uncharacterized protein LOC106163070 [Lingula anatina]
MGMADQEMAKTICDSNFADNTNNMAHQKGISPEEMVGVYDEWGENYDKSLVGCYNGPAIATSTLAAYFEKHKRRAVFVLDVAAGTGKVGEQLHQHGFTSIDGLDPSEELLSIAERKNIYRRLIHSFITPEPTVGILHQHGFTSIDGLDPSKELLSIAERKNIYRRLIHSFITPEPTVGIESDTYDAIVISGGMGEGHIKCSALNEMIRVVKKGGLICIVMRENYLDNVEEYKDRLEPYMKQLEMGGKWEKVERRRVPNYSFQNNGIVFLYKVL